ncbi:MAG: Mur ligase family protein, partial [Mycoplasmatales bacterium]
AVTGTNGKTSTTSFITAFLSNAGYKAFSCGNIGVSPLKIIRTEKKIDFLVMELSSFQLKAINKFKPNFAFFLNFTPDHLDYHLTLEDYYESKMNIFKNMDEEDYLFVNRGLSDILNHKKVYTSDYEISKELLDSINGVYSENIRLVVQFANVLGIEESVIIDTFKSKFRTLPHRMEFISEKNGVKYINDSKATNLDATKVALEQFDHIILLVGGYDKDEDLRKIRNYLDKVDYMISYGSNRHQFDGIIENYSCVETLDNAFEVANKVASMGSTVLLSPCSASYDQFKNYEHRGDYFRELVLKIWNIL